ncbi:ATP-binding protein [Massilia niabensis]|uniref:histidine kinase n=1 Tax=Massilia niabensis TaxID=544910 RepID=A0ABW0L7M5_9BURK
MFDVPAPSSPASSLAFASGGGQMGALLRETAWSGTGLGPMDAWPPALRVAVGIMLGMGQPGFVAWGPDLHLLFNDAYRAMLGARGSDPARLLGQPFRAVWPEIWDIVGPMFEGALRGEPSWADDHPFIVHHNGCPEQIHVRFSATPLRDETGVIVGVFCTCADTTDTVRSQRERDAALAELAASKETLEIAADAAEFGLFEHDVKRDVASWSPTARAHFGLTPDAPVDAGTLGRAVHPEDRERVQGELAAMLAAPPADGRYRGEYRAVGPEDGAVRWIGVRGRLFFDADGKPQRMVGATLDITQRKEAEAQAQLAAREALAAAEANAKFRAFFDQATNFAALMTVDGVVVEVNRVSLDAAGVVREDVRGRPFWNCGWWSPSHTLAGEVRALLLTAAGGETVRRALPYFVAAGGERRTNIMFAPVRGDDGRILFVAATGVDVTEQHHAGERLRLLDAIGEATRIAADPKAIMEEATRLLGEHLGVTRVAYADLEPDNDRFTIRHDWHVPGAMSTAGVYSLDLFGSRATSNLRVGRNLVVGDVDRELAPEDGAGMFNAIGIKAIVCCPLVKGGKLVAMMAVHQSGPRAWTGEEVALIEAVVERCWAHIERVRGAAALVEADRRKSEFLATLAHELRNPLAPIRNGLEILRLSHTKPELQASVRAMMERQLGHMVHLINDLLDIARVSSGKVVLRIERVALQAVVGSAVETSLPLLEAAGHTLAVEWPNAMPEAPLLLDIDAVRISQVLSNLLSNAAKYTPQGGRIDIKVRGSGSEVAIAVSDTGIGIAADSLPMLFEMFTQVARSIDRSKGGLGIGLALVRHLVQLHGGSVSAASPGPGQGSTFTVRLPLGEAQEPVQANVPADLQSGVARSAGTLPSRRLRVLVADDNVDAADTLRALLELSGHLTRVAHDGEEAVRLAAQFLPHIAFLDIGMPRLDGYGAARAIRALPGLEAVPLVALTGWGAQDDRRRSREAGFDEHLLKPAVPEEVAALLERVARC